MKSHGASITSLLAGLAVAVTAQAANNQILGWNNLGMHCMDSDYSVFSILPPYNTIEAQLIVTNRLVTNGAGYTITYQAVADPAGSINTTAMGKGNFYTYDEALYGVNLPAEMGLLGWPMPGPGNVPQLLIFERTNSSTRVNWWRAEGIPITPYDDAGNKNPYPMMRLIARNSLNQAIATNDIVLPVSDEMDCRVCHASGTQAPAQPTGGWVWSDNPERDYRLNILRLHDEQEFAKQPALYQAALSAGGFNPQGLYRGVVADDQPVLCARCHASEALPGTGYPGVRPLTSVIHASHASVLDPELNLTLNHVDNRAACYRCHPGSTTECLRGAMGAAVAADGSLAMQCQSCHGSMSQVGDASRTGWLDEPNCQSCHTGTATSNNGQIRYPSVFTDTNGTVRLAVNQTFATKPNTPLPNTSLYRFSAGHGGLQCSACHGSTHAEFPSSHPNDNVRNLRLQGHIGMVSECVACHGPGAPSANGDGGPHGMHEATSAWITGGHMDSSSACDACHGRDGASAYGQGTELSEAKDDRVLSAGKYGTKTFWRGYRIGCFTCHNGSSEGNATPWKPAHIAGVSTNTTSASPVVIPLVARDTNSTVQPVTVRVISQPLRGTVGVTNWNSTNWAAVYYPDGGFVGTDQFTFAAWNTRVDSALCTGTVAVAQGPFGISAKTFVPPSFAARWQVPFAVRATPSNVLGTVTYDWDFGDGTPHGTNANVIHAYSSAGVYNWRVISKVTVAAGSASSTNTGSIMITAPIKINVVASGPNVLLTWPATPGDALLEQTPALHPPQWTAVPNPAVASQGQISVVVPRDTPVMFYRLRQL